MFPTTPSSGFGLASGSRNHGRPAGSPPSGPMPLRVGPRRKTVRPATNAILAETVARMVETVAEAAGVTMAMVENVTETIIAAEIIGVIARETESEAEITGSPRGALETAITEALTPAATPVRRTRAGGQKRARGRRPLSTSSAATTARA